MKTPRELFERRRSRTRVALRKTSSGRPRLSVHRSSQHIYAQVIDDAQGHLKNAAFEDFEGEDLFEKVST